MLNTKFKEQNKEEIFKMTQSYTNILGAAIQEGQPLIQTIIYLNDNFEELYYIKTSEQILEMLKGQNEIY